MAKKPLFALFLGVFSYCMNNIAIASTSETDQINNIWNVVHVEGITQSRTIEAATKGTDWRNVSLGENLTGPVYLRTGQDSRIILKHRNDKITIASNSLLKLEAESYNDAGILTKIIQSLGYALFDIEKNSGRTNIVETPYLVSVVKGTTFTVQADKSRSIVNLIEGRLQIKATHADTSTIIHSGQTAQLAEGDQIIYVLNVAAQVKAQPAVIPQGTNSSSSPPSDKTSSNKDHISDVPGSTHASENSIHNSGSTTPASINSAVTKTAISAGNSGKIIYPGNNGNNGKGIGTGNSNGIGNN